LEKWITTVVTVAPAIGIFPFMWWVIKRYLKGQEERLREKCVLMQALCVQDRISPGYATRKEAEKVNAEVKEAYERILERVEKITEDNDKDHLTIRNMISVNREKATTEVAMLRDQLKDDIHLANVETIRSINNMKEEIINVVNGAR